MATVVPVTPMIDMNVVVPAGVKAGQTLQVQSPAGLVNVEVPAGLGPGDAFTIRVPQAQVAVAAMEVMTDDLTTVEGLFVKQKVELMEVMTGYETQNKYKVYELKGGCKGRQMFKAKEDSECCQRQFCGSARGFDMNIKSKITDQHYLQFKRPFAAECFCLCRSLCDVMDAQGLKLGEIFHPFNCCEAILHVRGASGELWYTITSGCYCSQIGLVCHCPCEPCQEIEFPITDVKADKRVGVLMRHNPGCGKAMFTDADNFSVTFPVDATLAQRACLFAAVFILDFILFEKKENQNNRTSMF